MTYKEVVEKVRTTYEFADARNIFEHAALQINLIGEEQGNFYIEIANRQISVEPYDYFDKDGVIYASGQTIIDICERKLNSLEALDKGIIQFEGNKDKLEIFQKINFEINE